MEERNLRKYTWTSSWENSQRELLINCGRIPNNAIEKNLEK